MIMNKISCLKGFMNKVNNLLIFMGADPHMGDVAAFKKILNDVYDAGYQEAMHDHQYEISDSTNYLAGDDH